MPCKAFPEDGRYQELQRRCGRWRSFARKGRAGLHRVLSEVAGYHLEHDADWTVMIKQLRELGDLSLDEAFAIALAHEGWNRWCRQRVTRYRECAQQYLGYRRYCQLCGKAPQLVLSDEEDDALREKFGLRHKRYRFRPERLRGSA